MGATRIDWDLRDDEARMVPAGMYFVRMRAETGKKGEPAYGTHLVVVR
jgi:hypothetical protein